jgi:intein-encoded DNA endonuclease-like protein
VYEGKRVRIRNDYYKRDFYRFNYRFNIYTRSALAEFAKKIGSAIPRKFEKLKDKLKH